MALIKCLDAEFVQVKYIMCNYRSWVKNQSEFKRRLKIDVYIFDRI